jgi:hypothetical protein
MSPSPDLAATLLADMGTVSFGSTSTYVAGA